MNLLVALIESQVLRKFFKKSPRALFGWMVTANYVSAIVGAILLSVLAAVLAEMFAPLVLHLRSYLIVMFVLALLVSCAIELPFVFRAAGQQPADRRRVLVACAASQVASYVVLLPFYWTFIVTGAGDFNAGIKTTASLDFLERKSATVVFLPNGDLMRMRLDGSAPQKIADAPTANWHNDLSVWRDQKSGKWNLWLTDAWSSPQNQGLETQGATLLQRDATPVYPNSDLRKNSELAVDWRPEGQRPWKVEAASRAFSPHFGLHVRNETIGEDYHLTVNTAFVLWLSRCPTILPGDQVVFELGGQIMVLDLHTRTMGFVAEGHSPIVVSLGDAVITSPALTTEPFVEK